MAQVIRTLCDQHLARDEEVDGLTFALTMRPPGQREQTYEVDLCDDCAKPLSELREWLLEQGRKQSRSYTPRRSNGVEKSATTAVSATTSDDGKCPLCDFVSESKEPAHNLSKHLRKQHGTSLTELAAEQTGAALPFVCELCNVGFKSAPALGTHKARSNAHK
jgi:hypothetical protein